MGKRAVAAGAPWLALGGLAVALRSLLFPFVFAADAVHLPLGCDDFYHLRRIWFTVVNFPAVLDFDSYIDFPRGARPPWPPLFDWSIAALARLLAEPGRQSAVEAVAVWVPPLLGALAVIAVAALARRSFGPAAGWISGLLLAILPVHIGYSELSMVDHHVAVGLFAVLLVGAAMRLAERPDSRHWPGGVVATGALAAAIILLWPGGLVHVVIVQLVMLGQMLLAPTREEAHTRARALAAMHALAALLLAPFCIGQRWTQYGTLSPLTLTAFQPLWFACGAAALWLASALWRWHGWGANRPRRMVTGSALAAAGLAFASLVVPGLGAAVAGGADWFVNDPFLGRIYEIRPLLFGAGRFDPTTAHQLYSYLFWSYPLAACWLGWRAVREGRAEVLLMVVWSATFLLLALLQRRWGDSAGPGFALVIGCALADGWSVATRRLAPARRSLALGVSVLLALVALSPSFGERLTVAQASMSAMRGFPVLNPNLRKLEDLKRLALWMRETTPPTQGYLDPTQQPEYGVISAWDYGHLLRYYSERPLLQDNFGPYSGHTGFDASRAYYESKSEAEALEIARRNGARYVVATPEGSGQNDPAPGTMAARLALARTARGVLAFSPGSLAHHRLAFVTDAARARAAREQPWTAAVYEIVRGASVVGQAPPGAELRFELPLHLPNGQALLYTARTQADVAGRYEVRLPYPTAGASRSAVRSAASYRVEVGTRNQTLALSEADVREGRSVAGPSFAP